MREKAKVYFFVLGGLVYGCVENTSSEGKNVLKNEIKRTNIRLKKEDEVLKNDDEIHKKYKKLELDDPYYEIIKKLEKKPDEPIKKKDLKFILDKFQSYDSENKEKKFADKECMICYDSLSVGDCINLMCSKVQDNPHVFHRECIKKCKTKVCPFCREKYDLWKVLSCKGKNGRNDFFFRCIKHFLVNYEDCLEDQSGILKGKADFFYFVKLLCDELYGILEALDLEMGDYVKYIQDFILIQKSFELYSALKKIYVDSDISNVLKLVIFLMEINPAENEEQKERDIKDIFLIVDNFMQCINYKSDSDNKSQKCIDLDLDKLSYFLLECSRIITKKRIDDVKENIIEDKNFYPELLENFKNTFKYTKNDSAEKDMGKNIEKIDYEILEEIMEKLTGYEDKKLKKMHDEGFHEGLRFRESLRDERDENIDNILGRLRLVSEHHFWLLVILT